MFVRSSDNANLIFIKSRYIKAFPCSRRRSNLTIDTDGNENSVLDKYYIPFDPEARLNTEANNRKHSALNGYKQDYLRDWNVGTGLISLSLAGYLFDIQHDNYNTVEKFIAGLVAAGMTIDPNLKYIYANIRLDTVAFFAGNLADGIPGASTEILRNQTATSYAADGLDILISDNAAPSNINNYYFSGLSFSALPGYTVSTEGTSDNWVCLPLFEMTADGTWQIAQAAKLPKIDHGSVENSIKVGTIEADNVIATTIQLKSGETVPTMAIKDLGGKYQLQFSNVKVI